MSLQLEPVFREAHKELRPHTPVPAISVEFFPFVGLSHTARLRKDQLLIRISDLFLDAPQPILHSLALILLAKLYRKKVDPEHHEQYRSFTLRSEIQERARATRSARSRVPRTTSDRGRCYDLDVAFDRVNKEYFAGSLDRPVLSWSLKRSRCTLGRYDATHHTIFISRIFDAPSVPCYVLDYVMFHEMLHVKHRSRVQNHRLIVHTREFRSEERNFRYYREATAWIRGI